MSGLKGDYMGFTYNGVHSSDLGIVRVSNGSRFDENLLPTIQDKTVQVPGGDGTYYFGSYYTQRQINVSFAFDGLDEDRVQQIRKLFGDKKIHELVFDETPYKAYFAKVTGSTTLKYLPFGEGEVNRVFKGEGSLQFTCYNPYAVCKKKFLNEYDCDNVDEWALGSGLKEEQDSLDRLIDNKIELYNPGVKDAECIITLRADDQCAGYKLQLMFADEQVGEIEIEWDPDSTNIPKYFILDSKTNLVHGADSNKNNNGNIYNEFIVSGDFFNIPIGDSRILVQKIDASGTNMEQLDEDVSISYNYYYF